MNPVDIFVGKYQRKSFEYDKNERLYDDSKKGKVRTHREAMTSNNKYYDASTSSTPVMRKWVESNWTNSYDAFKINYDTDEDISFSSREPEIKSAIIGLAYYPELNLKIVGNTSHSGTTDYNQDLSNRRAKEAYDLFMAKAKEILSTEQYEAIQDQVSYQGVGESNATGPDVDTNDNGSDRNTSFEFEYKE